MAAARINTERNMFLKLFYMKYLFTSCFYNFTKAKTFYFDKLNVYLYIHEYINL